MKAWTICVLGPVVYISNDCSGLISFMNDIMVIEVDAPTTNAKEAETEQFYEDLNCGKFFKRWEHQTT